ncbi:MAG TPA: 3-(methylthio)propionyl-CoA ligase [Alphaproteobacteria bacterium]|nr:3-(methylthio)propionyl-CoA ligase [Alphaproteobacteria bacterium]
MRGLMMNQPLLITELIRYAARCHADTEIVTKTVEGPIHRYDYAAAYTRIQQLAHALRELGVRPGDRLATMAWNGHRHFELYYAISGIGAICHTVNPRLFPPQIEYILNHAEDKFVFVDLTFVPLLEQLAPKLKAVKGYVVLTDAAHMPASKLSNLLCYEELIRDKPSTYAWPTFDEWTASSLCYTSGTTGNPKGVLYSHRSTVLHTFSVNQADSLAFTPRDSILPVVPLFHVNAWGIPYAATMAGAKLVFPGPHLDPASLYQLIETEQVTMTAGVPTIWLKLLEYLDQTGKRFTSLKRLLSGGSAVPISMIAAFEEKHDTRVCHAWGMTEISPVGTKGTFKAAQAKLPPAERYQYQATQGRPIFGVDLKIVDAEGRELPHDGKSFGNLLVRGPFVTSGYFNDPEATKAAFDKDGWFRTGDVVTIDPDGWVRIVDRTKDLIKSGGEWISSIDLENAAVGHPDVMEAAAIAVPHPKWQERPLLVVVAKPGAKLTREEMLRYLSDKVAKWSVPDDVVFVPELPHTATGKLLKSKLREQFRDYQLQSA